jgi:hypothetical protein
MSLGWSSRERLIGLVLMEIGPRLQMILLFIVGMGMERLNRRQTDNTSGMGE